MISNGYCHKILQVDLATRKIETKQLDAEIAKKFLGSFGVSLRLAYDMIKPGIDPLSPLNVIIIGAGPLVGTLSPGAIKSSFLTKFPLTGTIAFGITSMSLGRALKFAGYDNIVITGRADQPVYLKISDDDVQIGDARHLWGKDIYQTTDELWQELDSMYSVVAIGQAGENLVKTSVALVNKISAVGKGGLPAVMGSKNLKAIAVRGNKRVEVFAPERFKESIAPLLKIIREDPKQKTWLEIGKMYLLDGMLKGGIPYKNATEIYREEDFLKKYGTKEYLNVRAKVVDGELFPAPCRYACPAGVDVPRYLRFIAEGKFAEAVAVIREKIPFPLVCGRVCTHPCETECKRGELDEAIAIRALKRFAVEHDTGLWKLNSKIAPATGKRVAIIGSGPAGLTAAYYLAKLGHLVSVFEALPEPGGMMRFGIPDYRLPKDILRAEIKEIEDVGVEIMTNTKVDSIDSLLEERYNAVFLALGAHQGLRIGVEGEDSPRVMESVNFLRDVSLGKRVKLGNRVAVIGGGNAAIDAARTALRLGAKEVSIIYRRTQVEMPASPEEVEEALTEGVQIYFLTAPSRIISQDSRVELESIRTKLGAMDASGRRRPEPIKGSEFIMSYDTIIAAIGQRPEIPRQFNLAIGRGHVIEVDPDTLVTSREGVFAGGDVVTGPASVIEAIAAGRQAATSIDKYLGGSGVIDETLAPPEGALSYLREVHREQQPQLPTLPMAQRLSSFAGVELGLSEDVAIEEAKRCLKCDLMVGCPGCPYPCKDVLEVKEGEFAGLTTNISSFVGRLLDFGGRCGVETIERVVKCLDLANRYGIDSHIFTPTMDLAVELYQRGIITKDDTEGLVLKRNFKTAVRLIEKVAFRQGIGDILADGSLGIINKYGSKCEEYSIHIKGMDAQVDGRLPTLDPRSFGVITNPEGGSSLPGHTVPSSVVDAHSQELVKDFCGRVGISDEDINRILYQPLGYNVGRLSKYVQDYYAVMTCLGICMYRATLFDMGKLAEIYSATTGIEMSASEIREAGERIWNLFRAINVREGFSRKDDRVPARWLEPIKTAGGEERHLRDCIGNPLSHDGIERLLDDYYEERGWEVERGIPSREKLVELGLADIAEDLRKLRYLR